MARRPSRPQDDNQDDLFSADDDTLFSDDLDDDDQMPTAKADERRASVRRALPPPERQPQPRPGSVGVLGGIFQVVTTVLIAVPICIALGAAVVVGGRAAGVLEVPPMPTLASRLEIAALPVEATAAPETGESVAALPTTDPGCPQAQSWWDSQRDSYQYFVERFGSRFTLVPGADVPPVLEEMQRRLAQTSAATVPPCLESARASLIAGMTEIVTAYTLLNSTGDLSAMQSYRDNATRAFSGALVSLWEEWDVATDTDAPSVLNIPRLGGEGCSVSTWYETVREQVAGFSAIVEAVDPRTVSGGRLRQDVNNMLGIRDSVANFETPPCANTARDTIVAMMDSYINGYEAIGNADTAATASAFARASALSYKAHAWLTWLGAAV